MYWLGPILALAGLACLLYGFSKNNRKILFAAGLTLFLAGSLGDFLQGFKDGLMGVHRETAGNAVGEA